MDAGTSEGAPDGVRRRQADEELPVRLRSGKLSLSSHQYYSTNPRTGHGTCQFTHALLPVGLAHRTVCAFSLSSQAKVVVE